MLATLRKKPLLIYFSLGLLTLLLLALLWQDEEGGLTNDAATLRGPREPDSFIINAVYRSYDSSGHLSSRITSPRAEQFHGEQYALMEAPDGAVFEEETGTPWVITADEGRYDLETEELLLLGDVEVVRQNPGQVESRLSTERLTLDNQERIVHTKAPVTLRDFRGITEAVGMTAWIDDRVIEFLSQVEGEYVTDTVK